MKSSILIAGLLTSSLAYGSKPLPVDVVILVRGEIAFSGAVDQDARARVCTIFARGGIRLAWREVPPPSSEGQVLIELRYGRAEKAAVSAGALAYALPFGEGGTAVVVLYDRVRYVAGRTAREAALLAYVLSHEIAHVLARTDTHTPAGIMKAHWSSQDYDSMDRGALRFTPDDIELMRLGLSSLKDGRSNP